MAASSASGEPARLRAPNLAHRLGQKGPKEGRELGESQQSGTPLRLGRRTHVSLVAMVASAVVTDGLLQVAPAIATQNPILGPDPGVWTPERLGS